MSADFPRLDDDGRTIWACCTSSIGPKCDHFNGATSGMRSNGMTNPLEKLRDEWQSLYSDYENGRDFDLNKLLACTSDFVCELDDALRDADERADAMHAELSGIARVLGVDYTIDGVDADDIEILRGERDDAYAAIVDAHDGDHTGPLRWCREGACGAYAARGWHSDRAADLMVGVA